MQFLKLLVVAMICAGAAQAQAVKMIRLKKNGNPAKQRHYYIDKVMDSRSDTTNIGTMRAGLANRTATINLQDGAAQAITAYIAGVQESSRSGMPLTLAIDQLKISEKGGVMTEQATIEYEFSFFSKDMKLVSYSGSAYVQSSMDASVYIEKLIRQAVDNTLEQANKQWAQIEGLVKPAKLEVKVAFDEPGTDPNTIYYHRSRPLTIADFKGKGDDMSMAAAATYTGLGINISSQTNGGKMMVKVNLMVYADASKSWMRDRAKNATILSHEQVHFDIAAIAACKLKKAIQEHTFQIETLQDELMKLHHEASDGLTAEQDRYDSETAHGQKKEEQAKWKSNLESQLASQDCF